MKPVNDESPDGRDFMLYHDGRVQISARFLSLGVTLRWEDSEGVHFSESLPREAAVRLAELTLGWPGE